jgi:hypothetical protein
MSTFVKTSFIVGIVLILAGSFLPWERGGDFISYWVYGIRIYPSIEDNGGFLIVLLSLIVSMLVFRPFDFIEKPIIWSVVLSVALVLDSIFLVGKLLISRANANGIIGAPTIQIGLTMVSIGSIFLLFSAVLYYLKSSQ